MTDESRNEQLDQRIARAKAEHEHNLSSAEGRAENRGWSVGLEFVGAMLAGGVLGFFADRWLGTAPWLMIVLLGLGFVAGLRRTIASSRQLDSDLNDDGK